MPVSVTMPRLGESVTEGTVTRWLKQEGERVEADEPLLEVSTDKVDTEIPSPAAGVLTRIVVSEDETADVGSELAVISGDDEAAQDSAAQDSAAQDSAAQDSAAQDSAAQDSAAQPDPAAQGTPSDEQPVGAEQPATPAQRAEAEPQDAPSAPAQPASAQPAPSQPAPSQPAPPQSVPPQSVPTQSVPTQSTPTGGGGSSSGGAAEGTPVTLPVLGESVTEGTVTRWLKQVGDTVEADEPLLEVSTDKVDTEIPSPVAGTVLEIKVAEDETADVGAVLALIGTPGSTPEPQTAAPAQPSGESYAGPAPEAEVAPEPAKAQQAAQPPAPAQASAPASETVKANGAGDAGYVTPLVRKLAAERGVDLSSLSGTGVGGRIRKQDVIDAADTAAAAKAAKEQSATAQPAAGSAPAPAKPAPSPLRGRTEKLTRTRATIARRMVESLQISAQLTTVVEVDVRRIARLRTQAKNDFVAKNGVKLSFLPFFALAAVEALRAHPVVNASIDQEAGTVTYHDGEHLGVAVDTPKGLLVPVIRDAGDLNLAGLAKRIADVADRTRSNKISPDELSGGTFTLTNTGSRGALFDTPIINQPQVGILGTGAVVKRAVVVEDANLGELIVPRSMVYLALSYDHRLVDGADAARFLMTIKERLEAGQFEGDLGLTA